VVEWYVVVPYVIFTLLQISTFVVISSDFLYVGLNRNNGDNYVHYVISNDSAFAYIVARHHVCNCTFITLVLDSYQDSLTC
jgi:hypothetical protein